MRKILAKILQILDGTPAEYGHRRSGQSVVELALITPILIVLFSGMVEIGWFANNYLTLLDTTRAGARRGATLQNQVAPQSWDNNASYMLEEMTSDGVGFMPYSSDSVVRDREIFARSVYRPTDEGVTTPSYPSSGCTQYRGFYNEVICTMVSSMQPLVLNPENGVDDIIVSAFSLELVDPNDDANVVQPRVGPNNPLGSLTVPQMVVVGRYPINANECDAIETVPGNQDYTGRMDPRDPFDFNENLRIDRYSATAYDPAIIYPFVYNDDFSEVYPGYDDDQINPGLKEKQVGYVWLGQHRITLEQAGGRYQTLCLGSDWNIEAVENLLNLTGYVPMVAPSEREYLPGTGLVLVEIHWEHEMLLKLPVFNPVFNIMSPDGKPPQIYVWAAFPLPSTDPAIIFHNEP